MQTLVEELLGGALSLFVLEGVFNEDRGAGKAEHLGYTEEITYPVMRLAELGAVAFVEDEDYPLVLLGLHLFEVAFVAYGVVELLDGGDDEARVVGELANEHGGVFGGIDTSL